MRSLFFAFWACALLAQKDPLKTVKTLDLKRYMGIWHEVARLPNSFERNCEQATAEYSLKDDGTVQVVNTCVKENGHTKNVIGRAYIPDMDYPAQLKVNFVPKWLSWTGLGWGDYWVIDLDPNYQWAVVSEPSREYLWILSRNTKIPSDTFHGIINRLKAKQFNLTHLLISPDSKALSSLFK
jgi:apolipoprotein D and lipocalin family protein